MTSFHIEYNSAGRLQCRLLLRLGGRTIHQGFLYKPDVSVAHWQQCRHHHINNRLRLRQVYVCLSGCLCLSLSLSFCCVTDFLHVYANLNYVIYIFYDIHLLLIVQQEKVAQGSHHSPAHNNHNWLDQHYSISIYLDNLVQSILFTK